MQLQSRNNHFIFFLTILLVVGGIFYSCKNEDCVSIYNNYLLIDLIKADTLNSGKIEFHPIDTVFYTVIAIGNDSVFYDSTDVVKSLILPVNPSTGSTSYRLQMIDSIRTDTISFDPIITSKKYFVNPTPHVISVSYVRGEKIISEDCGVEISYTHLNVDDTTFPVTHMVDNKLSRFNEVNIEILF